MKLNSIVCLLIIGIVGLVFSTEWNLGEGSHVVTQLPSNVKEKMKLKYEKVVPGYMEKKVRLSGKITKNGGSTFESVFTVYRKDKKYIAAGQEIFAETPLLKDKTLNGKILSIVKQESNTNRRVYQATATLNTAGTTLKEGTILNGLVNFKTPDKVITVPEKAVHVVLHRLCVFVCTGKDGKYEMREIERGLTANNLVQITNGLKGGEEIVTDGSFHLRAELLKPESDFGGHGHAH